MTNKEILNALAAQLSQVLGFPVKYYKGSRTYGRPHCFGPDEPSGEFNRHRVGLAADSAAGLIDQARAFLKGYAAGRGAQ